MDPLTALREWLTNAGLGPGDRLPAERDLAERLGLSRAALRQALEVLGREGRLLRHVGRGTFLLPSPGLMPPAGPDGPEPVDGLADRVSPREVLQARLLLEPEVARLAAAEASARGMASLLALEAEVRASESWEAYDLADARFHLGIAQAAGNAVLLALAETLGAVRRGVDFGRLIARQDRPPADHASFAEHGEITRAIAARDRDAAHAALRHHLLVEAASVLGTIV